MIFSHVFTCNISVGDRDGEMKCTHGERAGRWPGFGRAGLPCGERGKHGEPPGVGQSQVQGREDVE